MPRIAPKSTANARQDAASGHEQRTTFLNKLVGMVEPVPEAAEMLGVSKTRVHQLIKQGDLLAVQIGKQFFIDSLSLQERIDSRGVHVASGPALNSQAHSSA